MVELGGGRRRAKQGTNGTSKKRHAILFRGIPACTACDQAIGCFLAWDTRHAIRGGVGKTYARATPGRFWDVLFLLGTSYHLFHPLTLPFSIPYANT